MPDAECFGLVKSMVNIQTRLTTSKMSKYGSIYYRDDQPDGLAHEQLDILTSMDSSDTARFTIGPVTERQFWADERFDLNIDRGPWNTPEEYFPAVAKCEIAWIKRFGLNKLQRIPLLSDMNLMTPEIHIQLLEQFLRVLLYILPPGKDISSPVLGHSDLHLKNIFVDDTDPTKISGIIDWQGVWAAPLFIQARFPLVFDCDGPYAWGAVEPKLPDDYDSLSESDKQWATDKLSEERLKKFYELASRKFSPLFTKALDVMRNEDDPTTFILYIIGHTWLDGPVPLRELLVQIYEKWDWIAKPRGIDIPCPVSFTEDQIRETKLQAEEWAVAFSEFNDLQSQIVGKGGWVSHEEYDEAIARFHDYKPALEELRERLDCLNGAKSADLL